MAGIVVGYDGSADAGAALEWAVREAWMLRVPLTVLLAWDRGHLPSALARAVEEEGEQATEEAVLRVLHTAVERAAGQRRPAELIEKVEHADAARALLQATAGADMLVLGLHGANRKQRLLAGNVADICLHRATVTTVVVRAGHLDQSGPVVVGVDGSAASIQALRLAAGRARARGAALRVVHAWTPVPAIYAGTNGFDEPVFEKAANVLLEHCVDQVREETLGLHVEPVLVRDSPARALIRQSINAGLLVVGSHGHGALAEMLLGSASHHCVHHAACPVAVVRATDEAHATGSG
ncbi:universal stress protein [Frankia sp. R82]|uniref:universal stress protein n=1 Tax=Frankia sp. R82 TaxID=2950553 RepID=UPI00204466C1|nr:universal stress protein [Frankia sp. R82]MCM3882334.1 universal stress protein [Frankia sp. R82]